VKTNPYEFNIQSKQMNRPKTVSKSKTPVHRHCNGRWKEHSLPGERGDAEGKVTRRIQLDKEGVWMLKDKGQGRWWLMSVWRWWIFVRGEKRG
jgi:hypothetical protein